MRLSEKPLFKEYLEIWQNSLPEILSKYQFAETKAGEEYQIQSSAVFSSNIEGNTLDLNSYMNAKLSKEIFGKRKEIQEIDDLVDAYEFAKKHDLNEKNFLKSHEILSKELLIKSLRGKYRSDKVGVFGSEGLVYLAVEAEFVKNEMQKLFADIQELLKTEINVAGVFYFALLIHLRFVHIHPFRDGNGRAGRLLEKWFLAMKSGEKSWQIPSEKYYRNHQAVHYQNISLGFDYYALDYSQSLPFLEMLPKSLIQ